MRGWWLVLLMLIVAIASEVGAVTGDVILDFASPGVFPTGLAFDGSHLWLADRKSDKLYRIDPKTGRVKLQFDAPGYFPTAVAWDGTHLWVADLDFIDTSTEDYTGKIYQVCPKTGKTIKRIEAPSANPAGLAWDGKYLWMSDNVLKKIICLSPQDGTTIVEFPSPGKDPQGLTWDGKYLWVADRQHDEIHRVHPQTGIVVMTLSSPGPYPWGLAWVNDFLFNVDYQTDRIYKIKIFDKVFFSRTNKRSMEMTFNHEALNLGPGIVENLDTYVAIPRSRDNQEILDVSYPKKPIAFLQDQWAQKMAHFRARKLVPLQRASSVMKVKANIFEVWYHIFPERVGKLQDIPKNIREKYLVDGLKYWISDPFIMKETKKAVKGATNPYWIARNIFEYLRDKMHYLRDGGWNVAPTVLKRGSGSCSEYTFVFISMCRAAGLPARYVGAVVVRGDDASMDYVFHRWPEVYLPGYGWIPTDAQAGDKDSPREQALAFGHLLNKFLITTESGGGSDFLGWGYNSAEKWSAQGPVRLRIETIGDWEPLSGKQPGRDNLYKRTKGRR